MTAKVFVAVGTDHHPFDRLLAWAARLAAEDPSTEWFIQSGTTAVPSDLEAAPMLGIEKLDKRLATSDIVVTHGGPGLIIEARQAGHVPVVVPRDPSLGEHIDEHQLLFTARLAEHGRIRRATTYEEFRAAVDAARSTGDRLESDEVATRAETVAYFGELVEALVRRRRR